MNGSRIRCVICHKPYPKGMHTCPYCSPTIKSLSRKTYICAHCGNKYKPVMEVQKYCCPECYDAAIAAIQLEKAKNKNANVPKNQVEKKQLVEKQDVAIKPDVKPEVNCMDNLKRFYNPSYKREMYKCEKTNIVSLKMPCETCAFKSIKLNEDK